jgi:hypothetical protein
MFSLMLFAISIVAFSQFALYYWRAVLAGVAAQPLSDRVLSSAHIANGHPSGEDFETLAGLHELTPDLGPGPGGMTLVRLYYRALESVNSFIGSRMPALAAWSERERALCARFAAVQIDRRLQANLALAASIRSC